MNERQFRVLGVSGSLRQGSYNRLLIQAAQELAPENLRIDIFDLHNIPAYDPDTEAEGTPEPVVEFKRRIQAADALLISTPEYNYGMPGMLKNAIDWASRPTVGGAKVLNGKPIALMGATTGNFGTVRAQMMLRQVFLYTRSHVMLEPEVTVFKVKERFDGDRLIDEPTRGFLREMLEGLDEWIKLFA